MKQSFAFVRLVSSCICLPMGSRSVVWMMEFLYAAPWLFFFLQKVSGQQILQECIKNFELSFFQICCSHPCFTEKKSSSKDYNSMVPKMLAINLFHDISFFRESDSVIRKFCSFVHQFFQQNSNKAEIKLHEQNIGAFGGVHKVNLQNVTYASFACCANFII